MNSPETLLNRLNEIGRSLARSEGGLALIGLGSVGLETQRLDEFSDLDFFAIVQPGQKAAFLAELSWLAIVPIAYAFRNTADGYKLLYADGIFCEFAVFEPQELSKIPFAPGRIVWKADALAAEIGQPVFRATVGHEHQDPEWLLGEALTCLYVGLGRYRRGEKLSAQRFIQHYAVDRLLELAPFFYGESQAAPADAFSPERRVEQRYPELNAWLPRWVAGYENSPQAALAILEFLGLHTPINPALRARILELAVIPEP